MYTVRMQTVFLAFGFTGNLMKHKGIPALFALHRDGFLPQDFEIVGLSRKMWNSDELYVYIEDILKDQSGTPEQISFFARHCSLVHGEVDNKESYTKIRAAIGTPENIFAYLCVSPDHYTAVISGLGESGFLGAETRLLIEKPFGKNGADADALTTQLLHYLPEERIFRVDHYLAKESATELAAMSKRDITGVAISLLETTGVEERGMLYDTVGALRDVGQNHMLEMLALAVGGAGVRAETLASLPPVKPEAIGMSVYRGQYAGYTAIDGVKKTSQTETYFKIKTTIMSAAGNRVAVTLEAGKRLASSRKDVALTYTGGSTRIVSLESKHNEYEALFRGALSGTHDLFVSHEEIQALWKYIDPIVLAWDAREASLVSYEPGTDPITNL